MLSLHMGILQAGPGDARVRHGCCALVRLPSFMLQIEHCTFCQADLVIILGSTKMVQCAVQCSCAPAELALLPSRLAQEPEWHKQAPQSHMKYMQTPLASR